MSHQMSGSSGPWALVEDEKRRDRVLRRVSRVAWVATITVVLVYAVITGVQIAHVARLQAVGISTGATVFSTALPLLIVVGVLSLLIATLSTVGIFLRLRTASLLEIQLRLAALEEILTARGDVR